MSTTTSVQNGQVAITVENKQEKAASPLAFKDGIIARFLPAFVTTMCWLYLVTYNHGPLTGSTEPLGALWNEMFTEYYPMSLAMILGSLIAGSTPLGGGVVAFPVAVLVIGFSPSQGRDFTVLIQSIGMNAAGFLILLKKPHMLDFNLIAMFTVFGTPGILLGLSLDLPPFYIMLTFQVLVLEFAFVFFYLNVLAPRAAKSSSVATGGTPTSTRYTIALCSMVVSAFVGGFLTANVGSGSDIIMYGFGVLGWNFLLPEMAFSDQTLTASSVATMGLLSLITTVCRALTRQIAAKVIFCWGATAWIVCFGAPLGSLLLTPGLQAYLRIVFYVLAILQFIGFAVLKMKAKPEAWILFSATTAIIFSLLVAHSVITAKRIKTRGGTVTPITGQSLFKRLTT